MLKFIKSEFALPKTKIIEGFIKTDSDRRMEMSKK
jgi:hypothetical protein